MTQPEPLDIEIPVLDGAIMYSMMDEFSLRRLRKFIDALIKWKAAGNACHVQTIELLITEVQNDTENN